MDNGNPCVHFLNARGPIFDVRSPSEFLQGHIPGAINLPLFTDSERAVIGTVYKQQGKGQAIELGFSYIIPKLSRLTAQALSHAEQGYARVHCWRGGMRSASIAKHLKEQMLSIQTLPGGYKTFRHWVLEQFYIPRRWRTLGGFTGSGKTAILHALSDMGEQILDLEALAGHRGSSFGLIGLPSQPTTEQFENGITSALHACNPEKPIWVEDESRMIGRCKIPDELWKQIQLAPLICIDPPLNERIERLLQEYGDASLEELTTATLRISRRLGGALAKEIAGAIHQGKLETATSMLLKHYDAAYHHSLERKKRPCSKIARAGLTPAEWAHLLVNC